MEVLEVCCNITGPSMNPKQPVEQLHPAMMQHTDSASYYVQLLSLHHIRTNSETEVTRVRNQVDSRMVAQRLGLVLTKAMVKGHVS